MATRISDFCRVQVRKESSLYIIFHKKCLIYVRPPNWWDYYNIIPDQIEDIEVEKIRVSFLRYRKTGKNKDEPSRIMYSKRFLNLVQFEEIFGKQPESILNKGISLWNPIRQINYENRFFLNGIPIEYLFELIMKISEGFFCKECGKPDPFAENSEFLCWACANL